MHVRSHTLSYTLIINLICPEKNQDRKINNHVCLYSLQPVLIDLYAKNERKKKEEKKRKKKKVSDPVLLQGGEILLLINSLSCVTFFFFSLQRQNVHIQLKEIKEDWGGGGGDAPHALSKTPSYGRPMA